MKHCRRIFVATAIVISLYGCREDSRISMEDPETGAETSSTSDPRSRPSVSKDQPDAESTGTGDLGMRPFLTRGEPLRMNKRIGYAVMTTSSQGRLYFEGGPQVVKNLRGTLQLNDQYTTPIELRPGLDYAFLEARFPLPISPPVAGIARIAYASAPTDFEEVRIRFETLEQPRENPELEKEREPLQKVSVLRGQVEKMKAAKKAEEYDKVAVMAAEIKGDMEELLQRVPEEQAELRGSVEKVRELAAMVQFDEENRDKGRDARDLVEMLGEAQSQLEQQLP